MTSGVLVVLNLSSLATLTNVESPVELTSLHNTTAWRLNPGALDMLLRLRSLPVALVSPISAVETANILSRLAISKDYFLSLKTLERGRSLAADDPTPVLEILAEGDAGPLQRVFVVAGRTAEVEACRKVQEVLTKKGSQCEVLALAPRFDFISTAPLEEAGAWIVTADLKEAAEIILGAAAPIRPESLPSMSFILMAFNEEATLEKAVNDIRQFSRFFCSSYEIIVVDDGSIDQTSAVAKSIDRGDLQIIRHAVNMGMGATMRDGYLMATKQYLVALPADRQVRTHSLVSFLPHLREESVVVSQYYHHHAGLLRQWISLVFRLCVRWLGGLKVDFAGAYIFSSAAFRRLNLKRAVSNTFVFSFELLHLLQQSGCTFRQVTIHPFLREVGSSRELHWQRMLRVLREIFLSRLRRLR